MKSKVVVLMMVVSSLTLSSGQAFGSATYSYASYFDWQGSKLASDSEMSQTITPLEISPSTYWEEGWNWDNGPDGGYGGIQARGNLADGQPSDLAIFSVWDAIQAVPGDANSGCIPFGGEGSGFSCRLPINLVAGNSYKLTFGVDQGRGSDWWRATIEDLSAGRTQSIGSIHTSQSNLHASNWNNFIEYWGPDIPCNSVGPATAKFSNPVSSNSTIRIKFWKFSKPTNLCGFTSADVPSTGYAGDAIMHFGGSIQLANVVFPPPSTPIPAPIPMPTSQKVRLSSSKVLHWYCIKRKTISKFMGTRIVCPKGYKFTK